MENQPNNAAGQFTGQQANAPVSITKKYTIFRSFYDMLAAVKKNPVTFGVTLVTAYAASTAVLSLTLYAMAKLALGQSGLLFASLPRIITGLVIGLLIYTLLYALVYAFTLSSMAFSLRDEKNSIKTVFKKALSVAPRVVKTNALVAIVAYWPLAVLAFLPLLLFSMAGLNNPALALVFPVVVIAALIWALIANLRFALAPFVAMFEPKIPLKQTLKRSEELLKNGGQWFIFKGVLLLLAVLILLAIATKSSLNQLEQSSDIAVNILFIALSILAEGALIMLYFNRIHRAEAAGTSKSPKLFAAVIIILIVLFGWAAAQAKSNEFRGGLSGAEYEKYAKYGLDVERKSDIRAVTSVLEDYYDKYGFYPSAIDVANKEWAVKNLEHKLGGIVQPFSVTSLTDPNGLTMNSTGADYQSIPSPAGCTQCVSFELITKLDEGDEYRQPSLNNTIRAVAAPKPSQSVPVTAVPTPTAVAKIEQAEVLYRVAADGSSAQLTPVTIAFGSGTTSVELTVNLQCLGTCQFKLASGTYALNNGTVYTGSQKIKYQITKPGEWIFYNQFTPATKFKIKF